MRVTHKLLDECAEILSEQTNLKYEINWAYGKPMLVLKRLCKDNIVGTIDISPRLSPNQLHNWISAYSKGIDVGKELLRI